MTRTTSSTFAGSSRTTPPTVTASAAGTLALGTVSVYDCGALAGEIGAVPATIAGVPVQPAGSALVSASAGGDAPPVGPNVAAIEVPLAGTVASAKNTLMLEIFGAARFVNGNTACVIGSVRVCCVAVVSVGWKKLYSASANVLFALIISDRATPVAGATAASTVCSEIPARAEYRTCRMTSVIVEKSELLVFGLSSSVHALIAPCPSNGSQRSSLRLASNRPVSFWPLLVAI